MNSYDFFFFYLHGRIPGYLELNSVFIGENPKFINPNGIISPPALYQKFR